MSYRETAKQHRKRLIVSGIALAVIAAASFTFLSGAKAPSRNLQATTPSETQAPLPTGLRTFFVDPNGNDNNNGADGNPWKTLQKAANTVSPGDVVYVHSGTYASFALKTRAGSPDKPVTIQGFPGDNRPVIDGKNATLWTATLQNTHDVNFSGFEITGGKGDRQNGGGLFVNASQRINVTDNVTHDNSADGIRIAGSTDVTVKGNDVWGNAQGIDVRNVSNNIKVLNNDVHDQDRMMVNTPKSVNGHDDTGAVGIAFVYVTGGSVTASGNRIWGNRATSYDYGTDGGGFEIYASNNVTMTDNVIWDNQNTLETGTDTQKPCAGNSFIRNIGYDGNPATLTVGLVLRCAENMIVANNTLWNLDGWMFDINRASGFTGAVDGMKIVNNILFQTNGKIYGIGTGIPPSVVIDYNLDWNPGRTIGTLSGKGSANTTAKWSALSGYQKHGVNADPLLVDTSAQDFHVKPESPAIDKGVIVAGVTDGFNGSAPDIGRYEN